MMMPKPLPCFSSGTSKTIPSFFCSENSSFAHYGWQFQMWEFSWMSHCVVSWMNTRKDQMPHAQAFVVENSMNSAAAVCDWKVKGQAQWSKHCETGLGAEQRDQLESSCPFPTRGHGLMGCFAARSCLSAPQMVPVLPYCRLKIRDTVWIRSQDVAGCSRSATRESCRNCSPRTFQWQREKARRCKEGQRHAELGIILWCCCGDELLQRLAPWSNFSEARQLSTPKWFASFSTPRENWFCGLFVTPFWSHGNRWSRHHSLTEWTVYVCVCVQQQQPESLCVQMTEICVCKWPKVCVYKWLVCQWPFARPQMHCFMLGCGRRSWLGQHHLYGVWQHFLDFTII